jgi:hypothetical protein
MGAVGPVSGLPRTRRRAGLLRGVSGVLTGGMIALVAGLVVAWVVALQQGSPGPGAVTLLVHAVAAVAAVAAQVYADRTPGPRGTLGAVGVIVTIAVVLTVEWLV